MKPYKKEEFNLISTVKCPKCGAEPGDVCKGKNYSGTLSSVRPHKERIVEREKQT